MLLNAILPPWLTAAVLTGFLLYIGYTSAQKARKMLHKEASQRQERHQQPSEGEVPHAPHSVFEPLLERAKQPGWGDWLRSGPFCAPASACTVRGSNLCTRKRSGTLSQPVVQPLLEGAEQPGWGHEHRLGAPAAQVGPADLQLPVRCRKRAGFAVMALFSAVLLATETQKREDQRCTRRFLLVTLVQVCLRCMPEWRACGMSGAGDCPTRRPTSSGPFCRQLPHSPQLWSAARVHVSIPLTSILPRVLLPARALQATPEFCSKLLACVCVCRAGRSPRTSVGQAHS